MQSVHRAMRMINQRLQCGCICRPVLALYGAIDVVMTIRVGHSRLASSTKEPPNHVVPQRSILGVVARAASPQTAGSEPLVAGGTSSRHLSPRAGPGRTLPFAARQTRVPLAYRASTQESR